MEIVKTDKGSNSMKIEINIIDKNHNRSYIHNVGNLYDFMWLKDSKNVLSTFLT